MAAPARIEALIPPQVAQEPKLSLLPSNLVEAAKQRNGMLFSATPVRVAEKLVGRDGFGVLVVGDLPNALDPDMKRVVVYRKVDHSGNKEPQVIDRLEFNVQKHHKLFDEGGLNIVVDEDFESEQPQPASGKRRNPFFSALPFLS